MQALNLSANVAAIVSFVDVAVSYLAVRTLLLVIGLALDLLFVPALFLMGSRMFSPKH